MRKIKIAVAAILLAGASMTFSSCIGSFAMFNRVLDWNRSVGDKFTNELVFFAFWVLPVYGISLTADALVLNTIEFWSGQNPMAVSTKIVDGENGKYKIDCSGHGYTITQLTTGEKTQFEFNENTQTWSVIAKDGEEMPIMTFVDKDHVKMVTPTGDFQLVELSHQGVMAYSDMIGQRQMMALR